MRNEQKPIELQRDTVLTDYKPLIPHDDEIVTFSTNCPFTPDLTFFGPKERAYIAAIGP